ncbi:FAD dependent oxidoreductase [Lentinula aciculospora]|uniref:FAD dependent oxidoreductase n=1 Tax=Lentinula aciculospora TaxID=153920 RepID=A0A9W9AV47_9AGAR|nr:FAD dependent oxidoreductase [Lentinula aciculospora]
MTSSRKDIIIIGGGIIGCSTAYQLTRHPSFSPVTTTIRVIEASKHGPAQGASGKAGGLIAKWAYPKELVAISFSEHVKLAEEHNGQDRWGWRYVECGSWEGQSAVRDKDAEFGDGVGAGGQRKSLEKTLGLEEGSKSNSTSRKRKGLPDDLLWVDESLTHRYSPMAASGDTAQVHPFLFTNSMMDLAMEKGAALISGRATRLNISDGKVTGVNVIHNDTGKGETLPATDVILAAGAWSPSLLSTLPISSTRAHSIIILPQPSVDIAPYVLFTEIALSKRRGLTVSPEIYARPGNEVYACGPGDDSLLPKNVDDVVIDEAACESIWKHVSSISPELRAGTVRKRQGCFLPIVETGGGPIIGAAPHIAQGLIIATGHTCWGICNAPGTAKALSELVMDGTIQCANLQEMDPAKYL